MNTFMLILSQMTQTRSLEAPRVSCFMWAYCALISTEFKIMKGRERGYGTQIQIYSGIVRNKQLRKKLGSN